MFDFSQLFKILQTIIFVLILYFAFSFGLKILRRTLLKRVKTKKHRSNVEIFTKLAQYIFLFLLIIFAILSYTGSLTGIGITAGLLSAAIGWALQRPITGIAAWLMVIVKRPFEIGDRVIIGKVKGDVADVTLTHIYIKEIGGTITSEETSGRVILIPNAKLFEQDIINYTAVGGERILDRVKFTITFESDLGEVARLAKESAQSIVKNFIKKSLPSPYVRTWFQPSGVDIEIRYQTLATKREEISSLITQEIFKKVRQAKNVRFAYPHTEILLKRGE